MSGAERRTGSMGDTEPHTDPGFLKIIGLVAVIVVIVILVFFGIGYLFGRLFL